MGEEELGLRSYLAILPHCIVYIILQDSSLYASSPVCNASRQDGLDYDPSLLASDDAEAEAGPVVDEVDHLHLAPIRRK